MTFEDYKKENYPNGCIITVLYGKGANIEQPLKHAFEAGLHADVHTDNSKVIADLQIENNHNKKLIKVMEDNDEQLRGRLSEVKEMLRMVVDSYNHNERFIFEKDLAKAETFLKEVGND